MGYREGRVWEWASSVTTLNFFVDCLLHAFPVLVSRLQIFGECGGDITAKTNVETVSESVHYIINQISVGVRFQ